MRQDRNYWSRHVAAWQRSGLSKKAYSEQHQLPYWSMRYWATKLAQTDTATSQRLVELERVGGGAVPGGDRAPLELAVGDRYVLRLWPHLRAAQLREVLAILESSR